MFNREITVLIGESSNQVFMQAGFFESYASVSPLHSHKMTEVQIVAKGSVVFSVNGKDFIVNENEMLIIPKGVYHERKKTCDNSSIICFQTTLDVTECKKHPLKHWLISELTNESEYFKDLNSSAKLSLYLGLILAQFGDFQSDTSRPIQDREFLIHEFFALNYNRDICLDDIANVLNLSSKQAERLIIKFTGESFKKTLKNYRIDAANKLISQNNLPLSQIAEKVGYKSYSGFWKAYNGSK